MIPPNLQLFIESRFLSPYALSAFVALHEKALPFSVHCLDLDRGEHQRADYASLSLTCRVPTLVDGGFALSESSAICEYLEEQYPAPQYAAIFPPTIRARARARQIQAWLRSDLMAIRQERPTEVVFLEASEQPLSTAARTAAARLFAAADTLLADGASYLFGDWCIADTDLALMLNRLLLNGDAVPEKLARYARQQWQRPSLQRWVKEAQLVRPGANEPR